MTIINGAKGSPNALHFNTSSMDGDGAWLAVHPRGGGSGEARSIFPDASVDEVIEAAWFLLDGTTRLDAPEYVFAGPLGPRVINDGDEEPPLDGAEWIDRRGRTWTRSEGGWQWLRDSDRQWSPERPWGGLDGLYGPSRYLPITEIVA